MGWDHMASLMQPILGPRDYTIEISDQLNGEDPECSSASVTVGDLQNMHSPL